MDRNVEEREGSPAPDDAPRSSGATVSPPVATSETALRRSADGAMARYARGESEAFRELYRLAADRLYRYLYRRTGCAARADELMQQTFLRMHQARGSFRCGASVFPWMYSIAHRLAIDSARRQGREVSLETQEGRAEEPVFAGGAADEELIARQLHESIERTLRQLPEKQRAAYELIQQEGLSYGEAAEALGTTLSAVTSLLHRANRALHRACAGLED